MAATAAGAAAGAIAAPLAAAAGKAAFNYGKEKVKKAAYGVGKKIVKKAGGAIANKVAAVGQRRIHPNAIKAVAPFVNSNKLLSERRALSYAKKAAMKTRR